MGRRLLGPNSETTQALLAVNAAVTAAGEAQEAAETAQTAAEAAAEDASDLVDTLPTLVTTAVGTALDDVNIKLDANKVQSRKDAIKFGISL